MSRQFNLLQLFIVTFVLIIQWEFTTIIALPSGAPKSACDAMMPHHHSILAQMGASPYTLTVSSTNISAGQVLSLEISGIKESPIRGILLQVRPWLNGTTVGSEQLGEFIIAPTDKRVRTLQCGKNARDAVTHRDVRNQISSLDIKWQAPPKSLATNQTVVFVATIAQSFTHFWKDIKSTPIEVV